MAPSRHIGKPQKTRTRPKKTRTELKKMRTEAGVDTGLATPEVPSSDTLPDTIR